jgi:hypothetical protein
MHSKGKLTFDEFQRGLSALATLAGALEPKG